MKKIFLISLISSSQLYAGDLIFKDGFENNASLSGSATGVSSTGLVLQLTSGAISENLSVNANGTFEFDSLITIGANWSVSINALPTTPESLTCTLSNNSGTMTAAGFDALEVICADTALNWNQDNWNDGNWQ